MSLLEEIQEYTNEGDLPYRNDIKVVHRELIDERRWYDRFFVVYQKGDELVGVEYNEGATEYQEDTELEAEVFEVQPREVVKTEYVRV